MDIRTLRFCYIRTNTDFLCIKH